MGHAGLSALFEALAETGPARVPVRWRAAVLAGLSESTFKRHFPRVAGRSWRDFIRLWRVSCARRLLRNPYNTEKQVARACGYSSTSCLTRAVRAECGVAPGALRGNEPSGLPTRP